jgi:amino acid permease
MSLDFPFVRLITPNTIIPLTTMIIIITIRSAHIGFEEAGIDDDTSVKNLAYESKIVIARPKHFVAFT